MFVFASTRRAIAVVSALLLVIAACIATTPATASTLRARSDAEDIEAAERIVRGRVESVRSERRGGTGAIETVARVRVFDDYTGGTDRVIEIREIGGSAGDATLVVPGAASFVVGAEVVALLERKRGAWRPSAMSRSVFEVRASADGPELVRQDTGAHVVGVPGRGALGPSRRRMRDYLDDIRRVKRRSPRRLAEPDAAPAVGAAVDGTLTTAGFTLMGNMRWHEADSNGTISWYRNTLTNSPLDSGNSDNEIRTALEAWTAPVTASISLAYAGTMFAPAASLLNCGSAPVPGGGIITYEDPGDDITTSGVIAIGGACAIGSSPRLINNTTFNKITYGVVIFTTRAEMPQLGSSLFLLRVLTHEIGHTIGLGHTPTNGSVVSAAANLMYPTCCQAATPVPPNLGPDDRAGLEFIYPVSAVQPQACTYSVSPATQGIGSAGGAVPPFTVSTGPSCSWWISSANGWLVPSGPTSRVGPGTVTVTAAANPGASRTGMLTIAGAAVQVIQGAAPVAPTDTDGDGLPDAWEIQAGLDPTSASGVNGAAGDPDGDGLSNLQEYQAGLHPRGFLQRYFAEGSETDFFRTRLALVNPSDSTTARVQLRFSGPPDANGHVETRQHWLTIQPMRRATVDVRQVMGEIGAFATTIESDTLVVADRTVTWDGTGYGSHSETATVTPRTTWYFAEGATFGGFNTFYLLQNPGTRLANVTVTYLRAGLPPRSRTYAVPAGARVNVWLDYERFEDGDSLESAEVSARIDSTEPIIAERAMYLDRDGQLFTAGHDSVGLAAPATRWLLAEGATGPSFDLFVLLANPSGQAAEVRLRFLLEDGAVIVHRETVPAMSRATVWVDALAREPGLLALNPDYARLADAAVSTEVIVDNGVGILVERAMWWPGDITTWTEAHASGGVTEPALRWAVAEGEVGGPTGAETYVLVANPSDTMTTIRATVLYESRAPETRLYTVAPNTRFNIALGATADYFPNTVGQRVGMIIESLGEPIVVERATYSNANGERWAAGSNSVGTKLP